MPEPQDKAIQDETPFVDHDEEPAAPPPGHMSFMDHLDELRVRLVRIGWGLLACFILTYAFKENIYHFLTEPLRQAAPQGVELIYLDPTEAFFTYIKAAFLAAVVLCAPWIFYQLWRFVAPGLYDRERRMVWPFVISSSTLFVGGAVFCFLAVFPFAFEFFRSFETSQAKPPTALEQAAGPELQKPGFRELVRAEVAEQLRQAGGAAVLAKLPEDQAGQLARQIEDNVLERAIVALSAGQAVASGPGPGQLEIKAQFTMRNYLSFTTTLLFAFGVIFETPLVLVFLGRVGVVNAAKLRKFRKYSILTAFVIGAFLTPPDVTTQIFMAIPMVLLYEVSIWLVAATERKKAEREAQEEQEENEDED